jgi:hypothetical protein
MPVSELHARVVSAALAARDAGFEVEREQDAAGLADIFPGMGEGLAEGLVTASGGQQLTVQLAYFDRSRQPVAMEIGRVLARAPAAGWPLSSVPGVNGRLDRRVLLRCGEPLKVSETTR